VKKIYFATRNKGKAHSLKRVLSEYGIKAIHIPMDLPEPKIDDLREIAKQKVITAYDRIKKPVIAIDSGFYIPSLKGFPGAFVNPVLKTIGIEGILKLTEAKPEKCEFKDCLAYRDGKSKQPLVFESITSGVLSTKPRGEIGDEAWSKLWLIFIPEGEKKTLAETTSVEYLEWSKKHEQNSYAVQFAKWFLNQK